MNNAANFKVFQASAGAGKTFTLIKEYLKLCLKSKGDVLNFRNILAITFTNAAANDMKAKIVKTLREIIDSETVNPKSMEAKLMEELGISDEELKSNAQSLMTHIMHDYSSFCVCTIDAFVQKLSRSFAHDLGLPSQYAVSIDTDEVAEAITEQLGLRISDQDDFLTRLLVDFSNNQFDSQRSTALENKLSEFITKLMTEKAYTKDERNQISNYLQYKQTLDFLNDKTKGFENSIQAHCDEFKRLEKQYGLGDDYYYYGKGGFVSYIRRLSAKVYEMPSSRFNGVIEKRNCFSKEAEKKLGKDKTEEINAALLPVLDSVKEEVEKGFGPFLFYKSQKDLLYLYALRTRIRMEFDTLANEEELVHISEFNKLLNTVMGDFSVPFVYERIGEHFRHVFVDEFQDTSVLQWQNLLPLIDNGLSSGHMSMVVGDGKQSIYRFRSGEVEQIVSLPEIYSLPKDEREAAFLQYEQNLKDNFDFKNLDTNYRSFAQVVDFNNTFFETVYTGLAEDLRKVYVATKPGTDEGVMIFQKHDKNDEGLVQVELYDADERPDYCFERVEALVRDLTENHGYRFEDIALLTRKSDYGSEMANYLNDKGIPVISQDSILLSSSDKVQLMVNTLRYLLYGDNESYIANVLFYWKLTQDPDFNGDVSRFFTEVKSIAQGETAIESVMGLGEAGVLQGALSKATCLYDLCARLMCIYQFDTIRDAFLNYFMEEVFKAQQGIKEGVRDFLTYWEAKQDKLAVMSASGNAVKIMTIHKSKGLEYPVVIYPEAIVDLDERLNSSRAAEEWLCPEELNQDPIPNIDRVLFKLDKNAMNMGEEAAKRVNLEKDRNRLDNLNLLYVAFTRAVQRLYIIARQGKKDKPNILREFFEMTSQEPSESVEGALIYRYGSPEFRNPKEKKEEEDEQPMTDSVASDWFDKISVDPNPTLVWQSKSDKLLPREFGELVHQLLAKIRTVDDMDQVLLPVVADGTIDQETADWIRDKMMQMSRHPQIADAFNSSAKVRMECEICYPQSKTGVIRLDRYAELPDVIYLIDYKTGKKEDGHKTQVREYTEALKEMTNKPVKAYLVYLSEDKIKVEEVKKRASVSEGSLFIDFEY